ncbi:IPT/TIG domain-containing protein [Pontibacter vulgaris]|uniref:IPT/TIG domain-containing protein n=1 Tax=Pontibacter vulgaris TaxID=2905679 RepID=UPI001FA6E926|nr:IPT/TIG domain-containing protein [Pontibacter vulgaris]
MTNFYMPSISALTRKAGACLVFLALLFSSVAYASQGLHMVPLPLSERVREADYIVEGEVIAKQSFWDAGHNNIYTSNTIKIYKVFKGTVQEHQLELITEGGNIGLKKHVFSSALELYRGQQGIFFLNTEKEIRTSPGNRGLSTRAYGSQQGFVKYNLESGASATGVFEDYKTVQEVYKAVTEKTGRNYRTLQQNERLRKALDLRQTQTQNQTQGTLLAPIISSISPLTTSSGTGAVLTINGSNFGNTRGTGFVEFRNADDGGKTFIQPLNKDYISWTNTQIKVRIPSRSPSGGAAGSGEVRVTAADGTSIASAQKVTIEFAYSNVILDGNTTRAFEPLLLDIDKAGGYTIRFAPSMQSRAAAQEGFKRAMNNWICATNVNWKIGAPVTTEKVSEDNQSVIRFAPGSETGAGVLARTISRWEGYRCDNDTLFWVSEFDMEINNNITWQYGPGDATGNQFDFETVMLHELGHAHQLGHVILPRAIMHYAVESAMLIRDLNTADITGARLVMSNSVKPNICERDPMVPLQGDCKLAEEVRTFEASFSGTNNAVVNVKWTTNNQQAVDFYVVQRSANGVDWEDIATVDAGSSQSYTYTDNNPLPRVSYYRLRVVYLTGEPLFSPRVRLINPSDIKKFVAFPNPISPATESIQLEYIVQASTKMEIKLYDYTGKLVKSFEVTFSDVNVPVELNVSDLSAGMYIMKWQEGINSGEFKIVKL